MKSLRRFNIIDATYFITAVTLNRNPLLLDHIDLFWSAWGDTKLSAWVILDDHFHAVLDPAPLTISESVHRFKLRFIRNIPAKIRPIHFWQNRFWDHIIRDQADLYRHLDYIHYNPVHHGRAKNPFEYEHSSLHKWYEMGVYEKDWGQLDRFDDSSKSGEPIEDVG